MLVSGHYKHLDVMEHVKIICLGTMDMANTSFVNICLSRKKLIKCTFYAIYKDKWEKQFYYSQSS